VFGNPDETLALVFEILQEHQKLSELFVAEIVIMMSVI